MTWIAAWVVMVTPMLWKFALAALALWFGRGLWRAATRPWVELKEAREVPSDKSWILVVVRQELLPPWRSRLETWVVSGKAAIREHDGKKELGEPYGGTELGRRLCNLVAVSKVKEADLINLQKP